MAIKTIPLHDLASTLMESLTECADEGTVLIIELPDQRRVVLQPLRSGDDFLVDDLIATNTEFQRLLAESAASPHRPFIPRLVP